MATERSSGKARTRILLTDASMRTASGGRDLWLPDGRASGSGALYGRITPSGKRLFVFRYVGAEGRRVNWPIGRYDPKVSVPPDVGEERLIRQELLSVGLARRKAAALQSLYRSGIRDLREHVAREQQLSSARAEAELASIVAQREAAEQAKRYLDRQKAYSLRALLAAYVAQLERRGKPSASDARSLFRTHVLSHATGLADQPARSIQPADITTLLRTVTEAGKGRTAAKLRSYLRAAYQAALGAALNPDASAELVPFQIESNPVASTASLAQYNLPRERHLNRLELRVFMRQVMQLPPAQAAAISLSLLLGGQRPTQLLRAKVADVDLDAKKVVLKDPKGRRARARIHSLPLEGTALAIVESRIRLARAVATQWLFFSASIDFDAYLVPSFDGPATRRHEVVPLRVETLSAAVSAISSRMIEDQTAREPFVLGDLRRTAETMMADLQISRDIRAQVQSHGLGGIQARHYDQYDYAREKMLALRKWRDRLERTLRISFKPLLGAPVSSAGSPRKLGRPGEDRRHG